MKNALIPRLRQLSSMGKYVEALKIISEEEKRCPPYTELLVWKSRLLQLAENGGSLDEVEETLRRAIALDDGCPAAFIELGWFQLNVRNDASGALECFQSALKSQRSINTEIVTGLLKCQRELSGETGSVEIKSQAAKALLDETKLTEALES